MERCYGYFRCPKCNKSWESAQVYKNIGTREVPFGQECKDCKVSCKPYRKANLRCAVCHNEVCTCKGKDKDRHVDSKKQHRADLCEKCRAGNPCM